MVVTVCTVLSGTSLIHRSRRLHPPSASDMGEILEFYIRRSDRIWSGGGGRHESSKKYDSDRRRMGGGGMSMLFYWEEFMVLVEKYGVFIPVGGRVYGEGKGQDRLPPPPDLWFGGL